MQHGILGPGGVGGLIAAVLADAGEDVTLIVRPGTESLFPPEISLESPFRSLRAPVSIVVNPTQPVDILWITVKSTQLNAALENIPRSLRFNNVVPLLNGIDHVDFLRSRFGRDGVIPATIAVESERLAPGKIVHRSPFVRFAVSQDGQERLAAPVEIFRRFGFDCVVVADETTLLWRKLVFLAPIALSTAAARSTIGGVLSDSQKAEQLRECVYEACAVATAAGAKVDRQTFLEGIRALPVAMRSSMERDVENGNTTELDAIGGAILRGAQMYGIPVHATSALVRTIQRAEVAQRSV